MNARMLPEQALARRLRRCYQYERNRVQILLRGPGAPRYRVPRCWGDVGAEGRPASAWLKLARLCLRRGADAVGYVQACLEVDQVFQAGPPEPSQLLSPARLDAHLAGLPGMERELALALYLQKRTALTWISYRKRHFAADPESAYVSVLVDRFVALSALFRHCLALQIPGERLARIADRFEDGALLQYQRHGAAYDRSWGAWLPPGYAGRAALRYEAALDQEP